MYIRREKRNTMNNNNFYQGYQTYLNYFRQTFGSAPVPSYNEWLHQFSQPNVGNSLSNHDNSWSNVPQSAASLSTSEFRDLVTDLELSQVVKKGDRWGKEQTKMLDALWKENIDDIESAGQPASWLKVFLFFLRSCKNIFCENNQGAYGISKSRVPLKQIISYQRYNVFKRLRLIINILITMKLLK